MLGLRCCTQAFSSWGEQRLLFIAVRLRWLFLLQSMGSRSTGFTSCGTQAQWLWHTGLVAPSMWDLPGLGLEPMSPALAGGFLTIVPLGKSHHIVYSFVI